MAYKKDGGGRGRGTMRYIALNLTSCLLCAGCWMVQSLMIANTNSGPSQGEGGHMPVARKRTWDAVINLSVYITTALSSARPLDYY